MGKPLLHKPSNNYLSSILSRVYRVHNIHMGKRIESIPGGGGLSTPVAKIESDWEEKGVRK